MSDVFLAPHTSETLRNELCYKKAVTNHVGLRNDDPCHRFIEQAWRDVTDPEMCFPHVGSCLPPFLTPHVVDR